MEILNLNPHYEILCLEESDNHSCIKIKHWPTIRGQAFQFDTRSLQNGLGISPMLADIGPCLRRIPLFQFRSSDDGSNSPWNYR
mgnify:CR=1 FL=1